MFNIFGLNVSGFYMISYVYASNQNIETKKQ